MPMPPVSVRSKYRPPASTMVETRSRVTPAVGSTMLIRRPTSQLNSDDLPTFGRPTIATTGNGMQELREGRWYDRARQGPAGVGTDDGKVRRGISMRGVRPGRRGDHGVRPVSSLRAG